MGLFDWFKRKDSRCVKCGNLLLGKNNNICSSCESNKPEDKIKLEKEHDIKFGVNLKITEHYQDFQKKMAETDDGAGELLTYWYDIIKRRASHVPLRENASFDLQVKELVYGNWDMYKRRTDLIDAPDDELEHFAKMRIFSFGEIYSQLLLLEIKIKDLLIKNSINEHKINEQLNNELAQAKSGVYGAIKYAISVNISKNKIREWFPEFIDDDDLIQGVHPFDKVEKEFNIDLPSSTPQHELSKEERDNIPEWYTGEVLEEGFIIKDEETGKEIKLTGLEASIYEFLKTNEKIFDSMIHDMQFIGDILNSDEGIKSLINVQNGRAKGKEWLKENNLDAYKVLLRLVPDLDDENDDD